MERYYALIAVWLVAGAALLLYVRQLGANMSRKTDNTPDGKLKRVVENITKARALLVVAQSDANEAGVPIIGELIGHANVLAEQAGLLADKVRFHADTKDLQRDISTADPIDLMLDENRPTTKSATRD